MSKKDDFPEDIENIIIFDDDKSFEFNLAVNIDLIEFVRDDEKDENEKTEDNNGIIKEIKPVSWIETTFQNLMNRNEERIHLVVFVVEGFINRRMTL